MKVTVYVMKTNKQKFHYLFEVKMLGLLYALHTLIIFNTEFKCAFYQIDKLLQIKIISEQYRVLMTKPALYIHCFI